MLTEQHGARLTAVHVVALQVDPALQDFARSCLISQTRRYAGNLAVETVVRYGAATTEIAAEARARASNLVVAGAHGGNWLTEFAVGGTAENLVRLSQVPVLVVRSESRDEYRTVLLGVDPSQISSTAARFGRELTPEADHIVVHISVVVGEHLLRMRGIDDADLARIRQVSTERVSSQIELLAADLAPAPAGLVIESGTPETDLPELVDRYRADLLVVGTGTRSTVGYAILGSVAAHMLRKAPCDVLIVPNGRE